MNHHNHPIILPPMMLRHPARRETRGNAADVLRVVSGYAVEWHGRYPDGVRGDDWKNQFAFLPGAFDDSLRRGGDIALTQDLNGIPFARISDGTLQVTSDSVGLLVTATLLNTPLNHELCQHTDAGKVRGWSHKFQAVPSWGQVRSVDGVQLTEFHRADLMELTLVVRKRPRQRVRATPIFLPDPAEAVFTKHCCCETVPCFDCDIPTTLTCTPSCGTGSITLTWNGAAWVGMTPDFCGVTNATITLTIFDQTEACIMDLFVEGDCVPVEQVAQTQAQSCEPFLLEMETFRNCEGDASTITITE